MPEMIWLNEHIDYNLHSWVAICSACKKECANVYTKVSNEYSFCPHCGAVQKGNEANDNFQGKE